jgi:hypothetical protein
MPLRDHFRSPLDDLRHWEGFHATWPVMIVAQLRKQLPHPYFAEPRVQSGMRARMERRLQDVYEVLIYEHTNHVRVVAAVEIVSPANKDREDQRSAFVSRCAALLRESVSVVIVDVVTTCNQSLYGEMLGLLGESDSGLSGQSLCAAACRRIKRNDNWALQCWPHALALGQPLPTLPLWLADNLAVPLELEESYEQSCSILGIS